MMAYERFDNTPLYMAANKIAQSTPINLRISMSRGIGNLNGTKCPCLHLLSSSMASNPKDIPHRHMYILVERQSTISPLDFSSQQPRRVPISSPS